MVKKIDKTCKKNILHEIYERNKIIVNNSSGAFPSNTTWNIPGISSYKITNISKDFVCLKNWWNENSI